MTAFLHLNINSEESDSEKSRLSELALDIRHDEKSKMLVSKEISLLQVKKKEQGGRVVCDQYIVTKWMAPVDLVRDFMRYCETEGCDPGDIPFPVEKGTPGWLRTAVDQRKEEESLARALMGAFKKGLPMALPMGDWETYQRYTFLGIPFAINFSAEQAELNGARPRLLFKDLGEDSAPVCLKQATDIARVLIDAERSFGAADNPISRLVGQAIWAYVGWNPFWRMGWLDRARLLSGVEAVWRGRPLDTIVFLYQNAGPKYLTALLEVLIECDPYARWSHDRVMTEIANIDWAGLSSDLAHMRTISRRSGPMVYVLEMVTPEGA